MKDKTITCIQCEIPFVLTAVEQERFFERGFSIPKRCPNCRKKKLKIMEKNEGRENKWKKRQRGKGKKYDLNGFFEKIQSDRQNSVGPHMEFEPKNSICDMNLAVLKAITWTGEWGFKIPVALVSKG